MRCDEHALRILQAAEIPEAKLRQAEPEDFGHEFLAPIAAVKVVDSLDEALEHIYRYGTGHSDAITEDYSGGDALPDEVDTAVCYVNASTQFTDGAQFGLGARLSTPRKRRSPGAVGLREITTCQWIVLGTAKRALSFSAEH
jgi:glutamate-5-semialdehyde dehydrogenase